MSIDPRLSTAVVAPSGSSKEEGTSRVGNCIQVLEAQAELAAGLKPNAKYRVLRLMNTFIKRGLLRRKVENRA